MRRADDRIELFADEGVYTIAPCPSLAFQLCQGGQIFKTCEKGDQFFKTCEKEVSISIVRQVSRRRQLDSVFLNSRPLHIILAFGYSFKPVLYYTLPSFSPPSPPPSSLPLPPLSPSLPDGDADEPLYSTEPTEDDAPLDL